MNVLSTFNGMGCIWIALDKLGIKVNKRYSSEIDKYANIVNDRNYPDTIQLGDVTKVKGADLEPIDLLVGGSPCQGFSFAGKQLNFNDPRSKLFFEFVRLWKETKPRYFLLENVRMKKQSQDIITSILGVEPIEINSALISATARKRIYWTNIPNVTQPAGSPLVLADVLEDLPFDRPCTPRPCTYKSDCYHVATVSDVKGNESIKRVYCPTGKAPTLTTMTGGHREPKVTLCGNKYRKLTVLEMERIHGAPENYTAGVSKTQAKKMLGNGWQVDTIAHIFKNIKL